MDSIHSAGTLKKNLSSYLPDLARGKKLIMLQWVDSYSLLSFSYHCRLFPSRSFCWFNKAKSSLAVKQQAGAETATFPIICMFQF